ncbi:hypothetical protein RB2150_06973 [Rhodobacterales bacterium HTCC2150]|nr:hypothetical protein RB2150_06973 [Rhodobacterales bacterium HTCC2150] [Rhodobacteraceae bacterium HTCC2150]
MNIDRHQPEWIDAFEQVFTLCKMRVSEKIVVLCEGQSRLINVELAELALTRMGLSFDRIKVPTPAPMTGPIIRSSGASTALSGQPDAVTQLCLADVVVDLTVEGLMHAPETGQILQSGARIMNVSNEHPEALARLVPTLDLKDMAKEATGRMRAAKEMTVKSSAGTDLQVDLEGAATVGVWGWTDRPGTLAHWPAGLIVSFPRRGTVNGRLVYQAGDINLTFKRYFEGVVDLTLTDDFVTNVGGNGLDARLMRDYLAAFDDPAAYATSHVGWGFNPAARYEALMMYDKADTNGTELRALAGNFLYSTGANEFAGRFTRGHFDLPMLGCDIALDGVAVVSNGVPV